MSDPQTSRMRMVSIKEGQVIVKKKCLWTRVVESLLKIII